MILERILDSDRYAEQDSYLDVARSKPVPCARFSPTERFTQPQKEKILDGGGMVVRDPDRMMG